MDCLPPTPSPEPSYGPGPGPRRSILLPSAGRLETLASAAPRAGVACGSGRCAAWRPRAAS